MNDKRSVFNSEQPIAAEFPEALDRRSWRWRDRCASSLDQRGAAQTLRIGFISPLTGALAGFGECNAYLVKLAQEALKTGIKVGDQTYGVEILAKDSQSDPNRAGELARQLITSDKIDLMLSCSAPETVNPVADACEAAGVPSLSTTVPWEAFYFGRGAKPGAPSPFKWTYHFAFGVAQFAQCYISKWNGAVKTNGKVGVLYPNDADGNAIRANLMPALVKAGFTVIDPGAYEDGTTDYSAQIARFKQENVEIINTFPLPPDFAVFWRQAAQQGLTKKVKIVETGKTGLFASQIEAMGALGTNMTAGAPWHPAFPYSSPLTGMSSKQLADGYEKASGRQWTLQIGQTMALIDVGVAALKASSNPSSKEEVAKAISQATFNDHHGRTGLEQGTGTKLRVDANHRNSMGQDQEFQISDRRHRRGQRLRYKSSGGRTIGTLQRLTEKGGRARVNSVRAHCNDGRKS